jgi:hypothetical protein
VFNILPLQSADHEERQGRDATAKRKGVGNQIHLPPVQKIGNQGEDSDQHEGAKRHQPRLSRIEALQSEAVFFLQRDIHPTPLVSRNNIDDVFQLLTAEALARGNLTDLLTLSFRIGFDLGELTGTLTLQSLILGARPQIIAYRHAEAVGEDIHQSQNNNDGASQSPTGDTGNDRESRHGAINGTVHEVFQVNLSRAHWPGAAQPQPDYDPAELYSGLCA